MSSNMALNTSVLARICVSKSTKTNEYLVELGRYFEIIPFNLAWICNVTGALKTPLKLYYFLQSLTCIKYHNGHILSPV
jgi:hypothetical protein